MKSQGNAVKAVNQVIHTLFVMWLLFHLCWIVGCSDECLTCYNRATNCSACRDSSRWLQEGRCVSVCSSGFYADSLSKACRSMKKLFFLDRLVCLVS